MNDTRKYWIDTMLKIADPVLLNLSKGELKKNFPIRFYGTSNRAWFGMLEAFGRTFCGFAPFLDKFERSGEEEIIAEKYRKICVKCFENATNPQSPDYMNFDGQGGAQPLVDAAFLAHGLVRSGAFIECLSDNLKKQIVEALKLSRKINPGPNNWILFSGMVEAGIKVLGGDYDKLRACYGTRQFMQWYKGDGMYGDGEAFHMDYYNSFVIQPMLIDIIKTFSDVMPEMARIEEKVIARAARYAKILEMNICHDGTYTYTGRSICYRFGAFQLLSQSVLQHFCDMEPAQVRCALTAVIEKVMERNIFDENGWLVHGIYGYQPSLAESYICTGSLYLCCSVFLPLGLPESDPFWANPDAKWTSLRIYSGEDVMLDHAISN